MYVCVQECMCMCVYRGVCVSECVYRGVCRCMCVCMCE